MIQPKHILGAIKTLFKALVLLVLVIGPGLPAGAQAQTEIPDTSGGLTVSAETFGVSKEGQRLHIIIHLLNTTNRDITVLTKTGTSHYFNLSADKTKFRFWFDIDAGMTWQGHPVVPSLPEFAPVTLKPGEVALCFMDVEQNGDAKTLNGLTKDSPIVVSYQVSSVLGDRFGCWSGRIDTKAFHIP